MQEKILALALAVSGGGEEHRALLETLCAAAETAWRARLRDGVTAEEALEEWLEMYEEHKTRVGAKK